MKTLKQWQKSGKDLEDFIQPGDWIDEGLFNYIGEIVCPYYCSRDLSKEVIRSNRKTGYCFTVPAIIPTMTNICILASCRNLNNNYHRYVL